MPGIADNALVRAARLIERVAASSPSPPHPGDRGDLRRGLGLGPVAGRASTRGRRAGAGGARDGRADARLRHLADDDRPPRSSTNVIPGTLRGRLRLPPPSRGTRLPTWSRRSARRSATTPTSWSGSRRVGGTRSPLDDAALGRDRVVRRRGRPGADVVPVVSPGFTDSHFLREAFGTVAYGFFPMRTMDPELAARLIHSADERIAVEDLELGSGFCATSQLLWDGEPTAADPPGRDGARQRGARARAEALGVRGPRRGRRAEGRLGPQAACAPWT